MSLKDQLKDNFSSGSIQKGARYANGGRVNVDELSRDGLRGTVRGSRGVIYDVSLRSLGDGVWDAYCECPHFENGAFCKHLWAALLVAGDELQRKAGVSHEHPTLKHELDEGYEDEDYEELGVTWIEQTSGRQSPGQSDKYNQNNFSESSGVGIDASSWRQVLQLAPSKRALRTPANSLSHIQQQILYVLDISESLDRGTLVVELFCRSALKNGGWGKAKSAVLSRHDVIDMQDEDRQIFEILQGGALVDSYTSGAHRYSGLQIAAAVAPTIVPLLAATGRFGWVLGVEQGAADATPLLWDAGPAWKPRLYVDEEKKAKQWKVKGELYRSNSAGQDQTVSLAEPLLLLADGLVVFQDRIARLDPAHDFRWVSLLRRIDSVEVPFADRQHWLSSLFAVPEPIEVRWIEGLAPNCETAKPTGLLRIHPKADNSKRQAWQQTNHGYLYADLYFKYADHQLQPSDRSFGLYEPESDRLLKRDPAAEQALIDRLHDTCLRPRTKRYQDRDQPGQLELPEKRLAEVVTALAKEGWEVEAHGRTVRTAGKFQFSIASGVDWFELESNIDFGEVSTSLPALVAAAKNGEDFVKLDDGSQGMLPEDWLARFAPLAELAEVEGDRLRFQPSQALLLDVLLQEREEQVSLEVDRKFTTLRRQLKSFAGVKPAKPPRGFRGELRPYQQQGLGWLKFLQKFSLCGCLADDMGLGKTVQVLALLLGRRQRRLHKNEARLPSLVVAPKSVVCNWRLEAQRFTPTLTVLDYTGLDRIQHQDKLDQCDVVLTTYGTLRRDIDTLRQQPFDYAVLDEAQAIKNDKSVSAKACRLLDATHRLTMTGTPIENHFGELWSQFDFLNPGMLGRSNRFQQFAKSVYGDNDEPNPGVESLRRGLAPFILRRTKQEVLTDLPEKLEQTLHCELLPKDRKAYDNLRSHYRDILLKRVDQRGMNKSKMHVLEALLRLRQAACHPGLIDKKLVTRPSAKVDAIVEQLVELSAEGHKALVFSQFTSLLAIVKDRLDSQGIRYEYLDGRTRKRQDKVDRFQSDQSMTAFLISLKAGGTGLNLTAADYVFLLDPWWNPAVESQAIDRAHRIGQQRRVFAYRLIARDTVEEKVLELQKRKRKLADAVIAGNSSLLGDLSVDDLQLLLS